jgi:hypothetical protein
VYRRGRLLVVACALIAIAVPLAVVGCDGASNGQPITTGTASDTSAQSPGTRIELVDQAWVCRGVVDIDLVKVTMRTAEADAVSLGPYCSGRVGRVEIETWTADGIKIQNRGRVAHDLVIESGYVKCHAVSEEAHQDGVQALGGSRITFRRLRVDCLGNSNFFLDQGGAMASTPTGVICDACILGPHSGQTLFYGPSIRSGARNSTICTGRFRAIRVDREAVDIVDVGNRVLPSTHRSCRDVTGLGRTGSE